MIRRSILLLFLSLFCFTQVLLASITTLTLDSGSKALLYLPPGFNTYKRTPFLMALHGMSEYTRPTLKKWQSVADTLGYILICPIGSNFSSGYTKSPVDDRLEFVKFKQELEQRFTIDSENSVLIGFSRGGTFALETGVYHPDHFKNVVSLFGYFNDDTATYISTSQQNYDHSKFHIVTGLGDYSELSSSKGYKALQESALDISLDIFTNLYHAYPKDRVTFIKELMNKGDENAIY